jgi:hypothetical protein
MDSSSKKVKFLLRVEETTLEPLRAEAKRQEISLSQLLRDILNDYVADLTNEYGERITPVKKREGQWWL